MPEALVHPLEKIFVQAQQAFLREDFETANALIDGFHERLVKATTVHVHGNAPLAPTASVILLSHRHGDFVEEALAEISRQSKEEPWEIILVCNGNGALLDAGKRHLGSFTGVTPPFPVGCSAGRNLGVLHASSPTVVFLDDDGIAEPGCIQALVSCMRETGAVAARGRVLPLGNKAGPHYDLGEERIPSFIDCECVSAWHREEFLRQGGFHPLLAGHEGIELCGRLWRHHGPLAFVYEPSAVFRHDFVGDAAGIAEKQKRFDRNRRLVEFTGPHAFETHALMQSIPRNGRQLYLASRALRSQAPSGGAPVSVITTARNAAAFVQEYTECWKRQTQRDFQLVFVDDGSSDGTPDALRGLWSGDDRLVLIEQAPTGRGAALNAAFAAASHDICLIADADDVSVPSRIARTVDFFSGNPHFDFLSFVAYNELDLFRIGPPVSPFLSDMGVRSLFHMPASFPTFACRKSRFTERFDESLKGGVDCDWLRRNMEAGNVRGELIQLPLVYYRRHEGQITRKYNDVQWQAREKLIQHAFSRILGALGEKDKRFIKLLVDDRKASAVEKQKLGAWVIDLLRRNERLQAYDPKLLEPVLLQAFDRVRPLPTVTQQIQSLRVKAERHLEAREYKQARRALRKALRLKDDPDVRARLLAAHRLPLMRAFSRSRPFQHPMR